jgi:hypothetical protein
MKLKNLLIIINYFHLEKGSENFLNIIEKERK